MSGDFYRRNLQRLGRTLEDIDGASKTTAELLREQRLEEEGDPDDRESAAPSAPSPTSPKPHPRAQWEERRAVWILWDEARGRWVDLPPQLGAQPEG